MAKKDEQANGLFNEEMLAKLKDTKNALLAEERQKREEEEAKRIFERKQREKICRLLNSWKSTVSKAASFKELESRICKSRSGIFL